MACLLSTRTAVQGTKISFALRPGTVDISLQGIVTRSEPEQGMVIQFTELTRESIRRLKIYILNWGRRLTSRKNIRILAWHSETSGNALRKS